MCFELFYNTKRKKRKHKSFLGNHNGSILIINSLLALESGDLFLLARTIIFTEDSFFQNFLWQMLPPSQKAHLSGLPGLLHVTDSWLTFLSSLLCVLWRLFFFRLLNCIPFPNFLSLTISSLRLRIYLLWTSQYTGIHCFIMLHRYCAFYKLKFWGNPARLSLSEPFSNSICSPLFSMSHFEIIVVFQAFSLSSFLLQWSMISDLLCYYCDCFWSSGTASK